MIEQAMIFALGFLAASLLGLLFLPVLSRRAVRLATRRLRMLVPLSTDEIVAERDQIRAEHAAAARRLEQKIENLLRSRAEQMSEAGRQMTRMMALEQDHAALAARNQVLQAEFEQANRDAFEARAELGQQMQLLHDTLGLAERRLAILHTTGANLAATLALADQQRAALADVEARSTGQDLRIRAAKAQAAGLAAQLAEARAATDAMRRERESALAEAEQMAAKRDALKQDLDRERAKILAGEQRYAEQAGSLATLATQLAEQGADLMAMQNRLIEAQSRREALETERDQLLGAREVAEAGRPKLETSPDGEAVGGRPASNDPAALRRAISALADDLLRFGEASAVPPAPTPTPEVPDGPDGPLADRAVPQADEARV